MTRPRPTATDAPTPLPGASSPGEDFDPCSPDSADGAAAADLVADRSISHRTPLENSDYVRLKKRGVAREALEPPAQRDPGEGDD